MKEAEIVTTASRDKEELEELLVADMASDKIKEVRNTWQFFRDRRPELYGPLVAG